MTKKYVYSFNEGDQSMRELLGGKGANLAEMTKLGLPVPCGFTVTTEACNKYYEDGQTISKEIVSEIVDHLEKLQKMSGRKIGDAKELLLLSVRSGARASMPGMMDTILNLGLNDEICCEFAKETNNPRFVYDSYRRLISMFADVVMGLDRDSFEQILTDYKKEHGYEGDLDLNAEDMKTIAMKFKENYALLAGAEFPQNFIVQLIEAITAVFRSWNTPRAKTYRRLNDIPDSWGTAVNVQMMVYGNSGENSGTGVAFTRNPSTGEKELYGEYLMNAQGEDVVAGVRTPQSIDTLKEKMPLVYKELEKNALILENHYRDMQDMEFTIEAGHLFMLQTRNGKRTAKAALKIAASLVDENMLSVEEALMKVEPNQLEQLLHDNFKPSALKTGKQIAKGLAASPGAAYGKIYFTAAKAVEAHAVGEKDIILVREETSPEDIEGMNIANGVLTVRGGMTSHAAVVARGMGRCCICGCKDLLVKEKEKQLILPDGRVLSEGEFLSLDGSTGIVYEGKIETEPPVISGDFERFMKWVDETKRLGVRANADTPKDAKQALEFGAEGIGLCRTEHMFFDAEKIFAVRQMITAENDTQRQLALTTLLPMQRKDFEDLFRVMKGKPVTIRYLDPPLHEFLPKTDNEIEPLASSLNMSVDALKARIESLKEFNPMMGHRGCRLDVTYPEIAVMQTRAVLEAAINVHKEGIPVKPEIMIPLTVDEKEMKYVADIVKKTAAIVTKKEKIPYQIGTMIEVPRATLVADKIAKYAEFFSFGTNDLTQLTYGFSRDDSSKFLPEYLREGILEHDPFQRIDPIGVGKLVETAATLGRATRSSIELGVCGEHGGDPVSVTYFHQIGLDYVSCSPYRIPIAKLAAAQAVIKEETQA